MNIDRIDYGNPMWLRQWLLMQHFRCLTWDVVIIDIHFD